MDFVVQQENTVSLSAHITQQRRHVTHIKAMSARFPALSSAGFCSKSSAATLIAAETAGKHISSRSITFQMSGSPLETRNVASDCAFDVFKASDFEPTLISAGAVPDCECALRSDKGKLTGRSRLSCRR